MHNKISNICLSYLEYKNDYHLIILIFINTTVYEIFNIKYSYIGKYLTLIILTYGAYFFLCSICLAWFNLEPYHYDIYNYFRNIRFMVKLCE